MTQEEKRIQYDRMRYTKDKVSSNLVLAAIVLDALYFVSIYKSDVSTYYYTWIIGASIIYNLLFMLTAFLASEGVKNRKDGYTVILIVIGLMQIARIFYLPTNAHNTLLDINGVQVRVMENSQYLFTTTCLAISAVCCVAAAITSFINNKTLSNYLKSIEDKTA